MERMLFFVFFLFVCSFLDFLSLCKKSRNWELRDQGE